MEDENGLFKMKGNLKKIIKPKTIKIKTKIKTIVVAPLRVT
jgi:hypothetical protein